MEKQLDERQYVPASLAIQAMRDSGYKNTAYALAELIDNSVQAGASKIELLCCEKETFLRERTRKRIDEIAVLDNGEGMSADVLWNALQFGNGTRLVTGKRKGIGRFGVGLPASSVSQCKRVDVWSWQDGVANAIHTYLDVGEITSRKRDTVPEPEQKAVPQTLRDAGTCFGKTGTLVRWSKLDRLMWRSSSALMGNSELVIGRIYRKFLDAGTMELRFICFGADDAAAPSTTELSRPNDPGYLMEKTSCPAPFDDTPMFVPWPTTEDHEITTTIDFGGNKHDVKVRYSLAKPEARSVDRAGILPHGKHAARNVGVSIVRAGRELELEQSLVIQYDPTERWWGVELEFQPPLDDLFGVTNNKQSARNWADVAGLDREIENETASGRSLSEVREDLEREEDPRLPLYDLSRKIRQQLGVLRRLMSAQTKGTRRRREVRHDAEAIATRHTRQRQEEGYSGTSDKDETLPKEQRKKEIAELLEAEGVEHETASELAATTVADNLKYTFADAVLEGSAFFSVQPRGGVIIITLNTAHPAYDNLVEVLEKEPSDTGKEELAERLLKARDGLKLLLTAWARFEDELPDGAPRERAQQARFDWGRMARLFLAESE